MRLIDAEHLKRWILSRWEKIAPRSEYPLKAIDIIDQIDRENTIEVEPRKHGHWEFIGGYGYQYRCSVCITCAERKSKFCPNCGAKMDL